MTYGIALDVGTSGYRTHLVDLSRNGKIVSTAITMRHPLPGANIMDHLHFWLENGSEVGHKIITDTVDKLIEIHDVEAKSIAKLAVCGNPAQVSMFQNIEVRDLAFAGQNALRNRNVQSPDRKGKVITAGDIGLKSVKPEASVIIPPAIRHEVGADALAMIIKTGLLNQKETCMVTDYGTNAEMGLYHEGELYTGSAAAGPAMEGQAISFGMLAAPYAISDLHPEGNGLWMNYVLDENLRPRESALVNPKNGATQEVDYIKARGITGTGVVAVVALGLDYKLISLPRISTPDGHINLQDGIVFEKKDLQEAGKAMGAIRAGHKTLIEEVGIEDAEIKTMYLAGASGTYVDPIKAQTVGLVPRRVERTVQAGNTSLMMAYDLVTKEETLDMMRSIADSIASKHIMFATAKVFEGFYMNELAYWTEGMPFDTMNMMIEASGLRPYPSISRPKETIHMVSSDIPVIGDKGLKILEHVGVYLIGGFDGCTGCRTCQKNCPERALQIINEGNKKFGVKIATEFCLGTACKKCEQLCPEKVFHFEKLKIAQRD